MIWPQVKGHGIQLMKIRLMYDEINQALATPKALPFVFGRKRVWLPVSQIELDEVYANSVLVEDWLVKAKGLTDYQWEEK